MIQKKSTRMIMFAVIAVIIVATPVSFYEFFDNRNHIPITVIGGNISCYYSSNFLNSYSFYAEKNVTATAYVQETGYNSTSINLKAEKVGTFGIPREPCLYFIFELKLNGSLPSNIIPTKMILYQNFTSPNGTFICADPAYGITCNFNKSSNLTYDGAHKTYINDNTTLWNQEYCLIFNRSSYDTNANSIFLYNFSFYNGRNELELHYPIIVGKTYQFENTFVFLGLEKPIVLSIDFYWTDVTD